VATDVIGCGWAVESLTGTCLYGIEALELVAKRRLWCPASLHLAFLYVRIGTEMYRNERALKPVVLRSVGAGPQLHIQRHEARPHDVFKAHTAELSPLSPW